jgi:hypothetical protein
MRGVLYHASSVVVKGNPARLADFWGSEEGRMADGRRIGSEEGGEGK